MYLEADLIAVLCPKTVRQLFEGHAGYKALEPFLPDFRFLYEDAHRLSPEELLKLDLSYFRSAVLAMALRHKPDLIFEYVEVIFEGAKDNDQMLSVITYILGVAERSPKKFLEQLENTEFTIKPNVMSTLEQLLEMGREEGLEKGREEGLYKKSIFNLLRIAIRFPELPATELSDLVELELPTVKAFLEVVAQKDQATLQRYVREELLDDIPLTEEEEKKLLRLSEELSVGNE